MQNAAKYAQRLPGPCRLARGDGIAFGVRDDGVGFDTTATSTGSGLQNMRDRLATFGGEVGISSTPGAGTTVSGCVAEPEMVRRERPDDGALGPMGPDRPRRPRS